MQEFSNVSFNITLKLPGILHLAHCRCSINCSFYLMLLASCHVYTYIFNPHPSIYQSFTIPLSIVSISSTNLLSITYHLSNHPVFNLPSQIVNAFFSFFLVFFFLGLHLWHMKVPRLGSNQSYSCQCTPQLHRIWAAPMTYITAHSNTRSLTHWVRPGIKPATSWLLVGLLHHEGNFLLKLSLHGLILYFYGHYVALLCKHSVNILIEWLYRGQGKPDLKLVK